MRFLTIPLLFTLLCSCGNSAETDARPDSTVPDHTDVKTADTAPVSATPADSTATAMGYSGCYRQVTGRDTVRLKLDQQGDAVTGTLVFDNYEKDSSHGTVKGTVKNDRITLWYDFMSEGMKSVSQIILMKQGDGLIRATGDIRTGHDTAYLANPDQVTFDGSQVLRKIPCE